MHPCTPALIDFRQSHRRPAQPPQAPGSEAEAYAIQDELIRELGWPVVGWKVGATEPPARERLGITQPFVGPVLAQRLYHSPAELGLPPGYDLKLECELGAVFKVAYAAGSQTPSLAQLRQDLSALHLVLEVVSTIWEGPAALNGGNLIADNGGCGGLVLGSRVEDLPALFSQPIRLRVAGHGSPVQVHEIRKSLDDALEAVRLILANVLGRGYDVPAGTVFSTGHLCGFIPLPEGGSVTASLENSAAVTVSR